MGETVTNVSVVCPLHYIYFPPLHPCFSCVYIYYVHNCANGKHLLCRKNFLFIYFEHFVSFDRLARRHLPNFLGHYGVPQALRNCVEAQNDVLVVQPALAEVTSSSVLCFPHDHSSQSLLVGPYEIPISCFPFESLWIPF